MSDNQYIQSTKPGYHWNLYTYKPEGRPGYAFAQEGKVERDETGRVKSFETIIPDDRTERVNISGRMTVKARNQALKALFDKLADAECVAPDEYLKTVS